MPTEKPPPPSALPVGLWSFPLAGLLLGIPAGWWFSPPGGLELAFTGAAAFGLYGALLGFAAWAIRFTPGWATLGGVVGAMPMVLLLAVAFLNGVAEGAHSDADNPMFWVAVGVAVSIPASSGAAGAALIVFFKLRRQNVHSSTEPRQSFR